jgi:hypothetical protein
LRPELRLLELRLRLRLITMAAQHADATPQGSPGAAPRAGTTSQLD